ncbi:MAG: lambda exonuclease family protein [Aeromonas sp.]
MEIFNCEQGTPEWFAARLGVVTASEVDAVMASGRGGGESKTRRTYMLRLAAEKITGQPCTYFEGNADTERGKELEPVARELYEAQTGVVVDQVGFIKGEAMGCSPDALVGEHGGLEIKCKRSYVHLDCLLRDQVPAEHIKQIQASLYVTGREWWDFVSYAPGLPLFIKRVKREEAMIDDIAQAVFKFNMELGQLIEQVKKLT